MFRRTLTLFFLLGSLLSCAEGFDDQSNQNQDLLGSMDQDDDGSLSFEEFGKSNEEFEALDTDNDGKLSPEEIADWSPPKTQDSDSSTTTDSDTADSSGEESVTDSTEGQKDSNTEQAPNDTGSSDLPAADINNQGPPVEKTYTTFIGDWTMEPGAEVTKCVNKRLDNEETVFVTAIRTVMAKGSHHLIVYKSDSDEEILEPEECFPFTETLNSETVPLIISQVADETLQLPPGIALRFDPGQMIRIESHYLNYFPEEITAHADVEFDTISALDLKHEANMLFYGTPDFELQAGESFTTDWYFLDMPEGSELFALTGHTHQYGTNVEIALGDQNNKNEAPTAEELIYPGTPTYDWDEPPIVAFDPPLKFSKGEGFRYRCSWLNTSDKKVGFGESADDEMCFFWGYYFPSQGYRICINPGDLVPNEFSSLVGEQVCCPESPLCELVKNYF